MENLKLIELLKNILSIIPKTKKSPIELKLIFTFLTKLDSFIDSIKFQDNSEELLNQISLALKYEYYETNKLLFKTGIIFFI